MQRVGRFTKFARAASRAMGHPAGFAVAGAAVVLWLLAGPVFGFNDTWKLSMNTAATVATFLAVFLIQYTQNRESAATQVKLDELLRANEGAHTRMVALEDVSDDDLKSIRESYKKLGKGTRQAVEKGHGDTHAPPMAERLAEREGPEALPWRERTRDEAED
jgi:low affinity Fe/Cu permease